MSDPPDWRRIETAWKKRLAAKNRELRAQGRTEITRYHAADCSSRRGEFKGWTVPEQIDFTKTLLKTLERRFLNVIAYSAPLDVLIKVFPEHAADPVAPSYALLLKFLMVEFASQVDAAKKLTRNTRSVKLVLFHERCKYDGVLRHAFDSLIKDETWTGRQYFSTLAPRGWEDCLPLQFADLLAYENYKESERRVTGRNRRKTLELMLANGLGGRSKVFDEDSFRKLRDAMENPPGAKK